jgi:methylated-DNA-protein-cysteine methyltransferase related protein
MGHPVRRMNHFHGRGGVAGCAGRFLIDPSTPMAFPTYERIYEAVRQIPRGKVATYGQIAKIVERCTPRMVGYAMAALRGRTDVPWQRVINAKGEVSPRSGGDGAVRQRRLLEKEGIRFDRQGRVDFKKYRWKNRGKTEDKFRKSSVE